MGKNTRVRKPVSPSRRQALGMISAASAAAMSFDPVRMLVASLVDGAIAKAEAASTGAANPRNYLYVAFPGAPCRWHFDLPLAPYEGLTDANYSYPTDWKNPGLATRFKGTSSIDLEYATTVVTAPKSGVKLRMPTIWGWDIPTTSGKFVPMATLLDHMIFIRGLESLDGHSDSQLLQVRPRAGLPSVDGAVADQSKRAVPALALADSPNRAFGSATGVGNLRVENLSVAANPLEKILTAFDQTKDKLPSGFLTKREAMDTVMKRALASLGDAVKSGAPGAEALWENRATAESLIRKGIGDVSSVYANLLRKYQNLVMVCVLEHQARRAPGVMDRDLKKTAFAAGTANYGVIAPFNDQLHDLFQYNASNPGNGTQLRGLPESFAIAEYLFTQGYSSAVIAGCPGVSGLNVPGYTSWGWDEHNAGAAISTVVSSFAFRAVAACLNELVTSLQAAKIFDETVIHLGGEFSRAPRKDMLGSDHSPNGNAVSLISGSIKKPVVIGNVRLNEGTDGDHPGGFGVGTTTLFEGGQRQPSYANLSSTLAEILRVKRPLANEGSLLRDSSDGFLPMIENAKNKAGT